MSVVQTVMDYLTHPCYPKVHCYSDTKQYGKKHENNYTKV